MKMLLEFDHKKATQVINYLAKKGSGKIDKLKLIKLIYFADRYHLRRHGRPILNDAYYAMRLGPVGSSVKDIAELSSGFLDDNERAYANKFIAPIIEDNLVVSIADVDLDVFSKSEIEALDFVYDEFGNQTETALINAAHRYPEWNKFDSHSEYYEGDTINLR